MNVDLIVSNPREDETDISAFRFEHVGCAYSPMTYRRDVVNPQFVLRCRCGLKLTVPQFELAAGLLIDAANTQGFASLPTGSYQSERATRVNVRGRS